MTTSIRLPDGRALGYAEYGDPQGKPVFFFHGIPGSRVFRHPDDALTASLGVRLITADRPGYGLSDFQPNRRILDWPADVLSLADALGLDRFAVAGHSGGGPYVAACAHEIPHRLTAAGLISGAGPIDTPNATRGIMPLYRLGFAVGRWMPWPLWRLMNWFFFEHGRTHPEALMQRGADRRPPADAALLARPEFMAVCVQSTAEGLRPGTYGHAWETRLLCRPWGFRLHDITAPVYLWHGDADVETPITMGRYVAGAIPNCRATFYSGEGHVLLFDHWKEIISTLL